MNIYESAKERAVKYSHHMRAAALLIPVALSIGCAGAGSDVSKNTIAPDQQIVPGVYREIQKLPYDEQEKAVKLIQEKEKDFKEKADKKEIGFFSKTNIDEVLKNNLLDGKNYGKQDKDREDVIDSRKKILGSSLNPDFNSSSLARKEKKKAQEQLYALGHSEEVYRVNQDSFLYDKLQNLEKRLSSPLSSSDKQKFLSDIYKLKENIYKNDSFDPRDFLYKEEIDKLNSLENIVLGEKAIPQIKGLSESEAEKYIQEVVDSVTRSKGFLPSIEKDNLQKDNTLSYIKSLNSSDKEFELNLKKYISWLNNDLPDKVKVLVGKDSFGNIVSVNIGRHNFTIDDKLGVLDLTQRESVPKYFTKNPSELYEMEKGQASKLLENFARKSGTSLLKVSDGSRFGIADGKVDYIGMFNGNYVNSQFPEVSTKGGDALIEQIGATTGSGCFLGGTKILMADGSLKDIREINKGDRVMSYSFKNNVAMSDEVKENYSIERDGGLYQLNDSVCVTKEHPFFEEPNNNRTKQVIGLRQNQEVVGDSNSNPNTLEKLTLNSIRELDMEGKFKVFNMTTGINHNYFVCDNKGNYFLVHNKGGGAGGGEGGQ